MGLYEKTRRVISSCTHRDQLAVANRYYYRAIEHLNVWDANELSLDLHRMEIKLRKRDD